MAKIIELIESSSKAGKGVEGSPIREIQELWTKDGRCIAKYDTYTGKSVFNPYADFQCFRFDD